MKTTNKMSSPNQHEHEHGHEQHIKLLEHWKSHPEECPLCIGKLPVILPSFTFIDGFEFNKSYTVIKNYNEKHDVNLFITNNLVVTPIHQLINQAPFKWLDYNSSKNLHPLYKLYTNDNEIIYIDSHLRQLIIWDEVIPSSATEHREGDCVYYSGNDVLFNQLLSYNHTKAETKDILDSIYQEMSKIAKAYCFVYENTMNTFLIDLIIITIRKNSTHNTHIIDIKDIKSFNLYITVSTIYNCHIFYKNMNVLDIDYLMSQTGDVVTDKDQLLKIIAVQEEYITSYFHYLK